MSSNYPDKYAHNENCSSLVRLKDGQRIRLVFLDFDVEFDSTRGQWYDILKRQVI